MLEQAKLEANWFAAPAPESPEDDPLRASYGDSLVPVKSSPIVRTTGPSTPATAIAPLSLFTLPMPRRTESCL